MGFSPSLSPAVCQYLHQIQPHFHLKALMISSSTWKTTPIVWIPHRFQNLGRNPKGKASSGLRPLQIDTEKGKNCLLLWLLFFGYELLLPSLLDLGVATTWKATSAAEKQQEWAADPSESRRAFTWICKKFELRSPWRWPWLRRREGGAGKRSEEGRWVLLEWEFDGGKGRRKREFGGHCWRKSELCLGICRWGSHISLEIWIWMVWCGTHIIISQCVTWRQPRPLWPHLHLSL